MDAGSFLKGKPGGVIERRFKVDTGKGCICRGVIPLDSLVFGNGICTFVSRNRARDFTTRFLGGLHKLHIFFSRVDLGMHCDEVLATVFAF
eukprot:1143382-Pelagomonas_calceolata.AAC.1